VLKKKTKIIASFGGGHVANNPAGLYGLADEALKRNHEVYLADNGWEGLINNSLIELDRDNLTTLVKPDRSMIISGSPRIKLNSGDIARIVSNYRGKDVVIVAFGGDDNLGEALKIMSAGVNIMGWDKTMDNDKRVPQICFGYHSFVDSAAKILREARDQAVTNRSIVLVTLFGRDTDFVPAAVGYWGLVDLVLGGESRDKEISLDRLIYAMSGVLDENEETHGVRFATVVCGEGAVNIEGYKDFVQGLEKSSARQRLPFKVKYDVKRNQKLQTELMGLYLGLAASKLGKAQNFSVTYIGRNKHPSPFDRRWGEEAGREIVRGIEAGNFGTCAVLDYNQMEPDNPDGGFFISLVRLEQAAQKRTLAEVSREKGIQPIDYENFKVTDDMGRLYGHIFGPRQNPQEYIPKIPERVSI